jgi:hypothetical protein
MFTQRLRANAVGALKAMIPVDDLPELAASLHFDEIIAKIEAGEYDQAFDSADGISLPDEIAALEPALGELVDAELVE